MRTLSFIIVCSIALLACNGNLDKQANNKNGTVSNNNKSNDSTTVEIVDSVYNFGKIREGEKVEFSFRFKNSGKKPLVIYDARADCGCTVPQWPEKPIMPGEMGFIKAVFNSQNKPGEVTRNVYVQSNAYPQFTTLILKGFVEAAPKS